MAIGIYAAYFFNPSPTPNKAIRKVLQYFIR
jgi:hypothetical protein